MLRSTRCRRPFDRRTMAYVRTRVFRLYQSAATAGLQGQHYEQLVVQAQAQFALVSAEPIGTEEMSLQVPNVS